MPLFKKYETAGSGIAKNAPPKKPFFRFWELVGRKFWKLMEVNMMLYLTILPLVGAVVCGVQYLASETASPLLLLLAIVLLVAYALIFGPSMAAVTKIFRNFTLEKPCFLLDTFFKTFRSSFKQAFPMGLINLLVTTSVVSGGYIYPRIIEAVQQDGGNPILFYVMFILTLSIAITVLMMSFYSYLMIVSTDLNFRQILKNALALSFVALGKNLVTLLIAALVMGLFIGLTLFYPLIMVFVWFFIPTAFVGFMIVFNCYPLIQNHIIDPYYAMRGEPSPEMEFAETSGENVFEDQGGKETPVEPKKKGKKGKLIS